MGARNGRGRRSPGAAGHEQSPRARKVPGETARLVPSLSAAESARAARVHEHVRIRHYPRKSRSGNEGDPVHDRSVRLDNESDPAPERIGEKSLSNEVRAQVAIQVIGPRRNDGAPWPGLRPPDATRGRGDCLRPQVSSLSQQDTNSHRAVPRFRASGRTWSFTMRPLRARVPLAFMSTCAFAVFQKGRLIGQRTRSCTQSSPRDEPFERGECAGGDSSLWAAPKRRSAVAGTPANCRNSRARRMMAAAGVCAGRHRRRTQTLTARSQGPAREHGWSFTIRPLRARVTDALPKQERIRRYPKERLIGL